MVFRPDDLRFTAILGTTWRAMLDAGLIEDMALSDFLLTPFGWFTGLKQSGESHERRHSSTGSEDRQRAEEAG